MKNIYIYVLHSSLRRFRLSVGSRYSERLLPVASGLKSINYGIVGYGGAGVCDSVHSHTIDGQLMNTRDKVLLGLDKWTMEGGDNDDSMLAVRLAADYPFRMGASKNILLLPCDACQEDAVTYADMQRLLLAKDIRLHVLMQHDIRLRSKSSKQSFIFGELTIHHRLEFVCVEV